MAAKGFREVYQPYREDHARFTLVYARYLRAYRESLETLKLPKPDTFIGRKTQEPFPLEAETIDAAQVGTDMRQK